MPHYAKGAMPSIVLNLLCRKMLVACAVRLTYTASIVSYIASPS